MTLALAACSRDGATAAERVPERVVVLGPSTVETLFALGLGSRVVAADDYTVWPEAAALPRVGGQFNPNFEAITAQAPDLVIIQGEFPELARVCASLGIRLLSLKTDTWAAWEDEVRQLGDLFRVPQAAEDLVRTRRAELAAIPRASTPLPCLLVVGRKPGEAAGLVVVGAGSFLNELLAAAGGRNAFADNPRNYFDLSEEALIRAAPEVIFEFRPGEAESAATETRSAWQRSFPDLPAVRNSRIHVLTEDFILLPGPRMPEIARILAALLQ